LCTVTTRTVRALAWSILAAAVAALGGCGAGLISGVVASSGGSERTPPPEVSIQAGSLLPLVPPADFRAAVLILNASLGGVSDLVVVLEANVGGGVVRQDQGAVLVSPEGPNSRVSFAVATNAIVAVLGDPTASSVPARLWVEVDGKLVGDTVPVLLGAQPQIVGALQLDAADEVVLDGDDEPIVTDDMAPVRASGGAVAVLASGLRADSTISAYVAALTPQGVEVRTEAVVESTVLDAVSGLATMRVEVPGNAWPQEAFLVVVDSQVGESVRERFHYRPEVNVNLVSQGATSGGQVVTVVGDGLVPYSLAAGGALDFDRVQVSFRKRRAVGGAPFGNSTPRVVDLPREDFRVDESSNDRLVFNIPPSPDGRPGNVDISVRVCLGEGGPITFDEDEAEALGVVVVSTTAEDLFLYSNPDPVFGPRGAIFETLPITAAPIAIDDVMTEPGPVVVDLAPDFVALSEQGGVAYLQLLLAQQNGMFQPFGKPRRVGDPQAAREHDPRDLLVGDFNRDGIPDVFVVNAGLDAMDPDADHLIVLGQERPAPPFGGVHRVTSPGRCARGRVVDFNADGFPDVLLVPDAQATGRRPYVLFNLQPNDGAPSFSAPFEVPIDVPCEAFEVADVDGDGFLDVAVFSGTQMQLVVAYGDATGTYDQAAAQVTDIAITHGPSFQSYVPRPDSPAVGLHVCRDGPLQSLAVVLTGTSSFAATPPLVSVLSQPAPRAFVGVDGGTTVSPEPIGLSLAADLDADAVPDGRIELVVAGRGDPVLVSLALLRFRPAGVEPARFDVLADAIETGAESPKQIRAMVFDRAVPSLLSGAGDEAEAVFIVHESEIDGGREKRLSTRLVRASAQNPDGLLLLPADAGDQLPFALHDLVVGTFHTASSNGVGKVPDLAVLDVSGGGSSSINLILNDGFGGFPVLGGRLDIAVLLDTSLSILPRAGVESTDALAVLDANANLHFWAPDLLAGPGISQSPTASVSLLPPEFAGMTLSARSTLRVGSFDDDPHDDLLVLLSFDGAGEQATRVAVLPGRSSLGGTQLPFEISGGQPNWATLPTMVSDVVIGDFCAPAGAREIAVAVPQIDSAGVGEHVRFLRFAVESGAFVPSAAGDVLYLHAGDAPTRLASVDFDGDGDSDLLVAGGTPDLRLFRNVGWQVSQPEVRVDAFLESATSPIGLLQGTPTDLQVSDVDGDGTTDAVVFLERTELIAGLPERRASVATSFNVGGTDLSEAVFTSPTRIGEFDASLSGALGDWNLDGVPDLFVGWDQLTGINLRVLFGGTR